MKSFEYKFQASYKKLSYSKNENKKPRKKKIKKQVLIFGAKYYKSPINLQHSPY